MTREEWLTKAIESLKPIFKTAGKDLPPIKVSVGFPGGRGAKKNAIGQAWHPRCADDGVAQVFISPVLKTGLEAIDTLTHELVHTCVPEAKHGKVFIALGKAVGLTGNPRSMGAGDDLKVILQTIIDGLGEYPHSGLNVSQQHRHTQPTALRKVLCDACGYTVRTTIKWLDLYGAPICPCTGDSVMTVDESTMPKPNPELEG